MPKLEFWYIEVRKTAIWSKTPNFAFFFSELWLLVPKLNSKENLRKEKEFFWVNLFCKTTFFRKRFIPKKNNVNGKKLRRQWTLKNFIGGSRHLAFWWLPSYMILVALVIWYLRRYAKFGVFFLLVRDCGP